jgi:GNAT superfamily N-acetyltransferase
MIHELAEFEKAVEKCTVTETRLHAALFGPDPTASAHVVEVGGQAAACAVWFRTFSTWDGVAGIYLEDLFVRPEHRGNGVGKALLVHLAATAVREGCGRFVWQVLDWNAPAISFYEALGARPLPEWLTMRVKGEALRTLAASAGAG